MIGSVNSSTVSAQAYGPVTQTRQIPQAENKETKASEKNESAATQLREPESSKSGAALMKTLNSNEAQNLPPAASQQDSNTQASRISGLKAYNEVGKSQFNFA